MEEYTYQKEVDKSKLIPLENSLEQFLISKRDGTTHNFEQAKIYAFLQRYTYDLQFICVDTLIKEIVRNIYSGISTQDLHKAAIFAAVSYIEQDPEYDTLAARLLLQYNYKDVLGSFKGETSFSAFYKEAFMRSITKGVEEKIFNSQLLEFDLVLLANYLKPDRDHLFNYLGLQTLYERYFLKINERRLETPQMFFMRIAMGLSLQETNPVERALEFYEILSTLRYIPSTPTLFHAGYARAQLSSCYLTTISDDLGHIFKCIGDNAQLSKWAGGIGNDWTNIRATGARIKSIHANSQGVIPFLKIANDVVIGITKGGIRRGGTAVYLETWHLDIEDFLDLRRNTGDERRRTHDMNTANWIPDLFMKRMLRDEEWTLFSPHEVPDLHDLYGKAFEERYLFYEQQAREGKILLFKTVSAQKLWRKMLTRLFETGHPWITFKDPCNVRSPQDHVGVVHSSNLCTEITLNTSDSETAVCNLGSINLARHITNGVLDELLLKDTITKAIRMLDNVIDLNFYPTKEAENSNIRHRPIGLGIMGFQDALFKFNIPFCSSAAIEAADILQEKISYYAFQASSNLAAERGSYSTFKGSKWDRGIFPLDTLDLLEQEREMPIEVSRTSRLDWAALKELVKVQGMRNSNVLSIAPTATIANIAGCYPCIEPIYRNIYVKANVTGEFTIVNKDLVKDLKELNLWNKQMLEKIKYYDGQIGAIEEIPETLKQKYKVAFELDPVHMIRITAARGKWIDQSQSHNVFMQGVDGKKLDEIYKTAWHTGLKTTYYLRTLGATQIEKATLGTQWGFTQKREYTNPVNNAVPSQQEKGATEVKKENVMTAEKGEEINNFVFSGESATTVGLLCELDPGCESCQ